MHTRRSARLFPQTLEKSPLFVLAWLHWVIVPPRGLVAHVLTSTVLNPCRLDLSLAFRQISVADGQRSGVGARFPSSQRLPPAAFSATQWFRLINWGWEFEIFM